MQDKRTKRQLQSELAEQADLREAMAGELWLHNRAMDYANNGIIITDNTQPDNPIIYANEAFLNLTGYSCDQVLGQNCRFLQGEATDPETVTIMREAIEHEAAVKVTILNYRQDKTTFWSELSLAPVPDPTGKITHFIGAQIDVTDKIEHGETLKRQVAERTQQLEGLNRALEIHRDKLEFSNYELDQFASVASHDLQEPLRMVSSYLRLIDRRYGSMLDDDGHEFMGYALDGADRMKRLIADLAEYARLDAREQAFKPVHLGDAVQEAIEDQRLIIAETGAHVTSGLMPHVSGDKTQLIQLFQNLIANALKYRGAEPPAITVRASHHDGLAHITVTDNGIGIAERDTERIFLVFRQVDRSSRQHGTGIGLATAKKIVVRHGGKIWVESKLGRGSTFHITFPDINQEHTRERQHEAH